MGSGGREWHDTPDVTPSIHTLHLSFPFIKEYHFFVQKILAMAAADEYRVARSSSKPAAGVSTGSFLRKLPVLLTRTLFPWEVA
jgi:hypothetical protein